MKTKNPAGFIETSSLNEEKLRKKEADLILREENLRQKEIEATAQEAEHFKAMADLKKEKLTYQCLVEDLSRQKAMLIQLCKNIDFEYN